MKLSIRKDKLLLILNGDESIVELMSDCLDDFKYLLDPLGDEGMIRFNTKYPGFYRFS